MANSFKLFNYSLLVNTLSGFICLHNLKKSSSTLSFITHLLYKGIYHFIVTSKHTARCVAVTGQQCIFVVSGEICKWLRVCETGIAKIHWLLQSSIRFWINGTSEWYRKQITKNRFVCSMQVCIRPAVIHIVDAHTF